MTKNLSISDIQSAAWNSLLAEGEPNPAQLREFLHGLAVSNQPIYYPPSVRNNTNVMDMVAKALQSADSHHPHYIDIPTGARMVGYSAIHAYVLQGKLNRTTKEEDELAGYMAAVRDLAPQVTSMTGAHYIDRDPNPMIYLKSVFRAVAETTKTFELAIPAYIFDRLSMLFTSSPTHEIQAILIDIDNYLAGPSAKINLGFPGIAIRPPASYEDVKKMAEESLFPDNRTTPFILPDVAARVTNGYYNFNAERAITDVMRQRAGTNPNFFADLIVIAATTDQRLANELAPIDAAFHGSTNHTNRLRRQIMDGLNFIAPVAHEFHAEKGHEVIVDQNDMAKHLQTAREIYVVQGNAAGSARCDVLLKTIAAPIPTIIEIKPAQHEESVVAAVVAVATQRQLTQ